MAPRFNGRKCRTREEAVARFSRCIQRGADDECWPWLRGVDSRGYGTTGTEAGRVKAHRFAYEIAKGDIPPGMVIMHSCDNPRCCNPAHLSAGTQAENTRDMAAKGRAHAQSRTHCINGHPFDEKNTAISYSANGRPFRSCRACCSIRSKAYLQRKAARHRSERIAQPLPPILSETSHPSDLDEERR